MELIDYFDLSLFKKTLRWIIENNKANQKPYHNLDHLLSTFKNTQDMVHYYDLDEELKKCLGVAALFHDVNHSGIADQEDPKADWLNIQKALKAFQDFEKEVLNKDLSHQDIWLIQDLIKSTKYPHEDFLRENPLLEGIIRDADMMSTYNYDWISNVIVGISEERGIKVADQILDQEKFFNNLITYTEWGTARWVLNKNRILKKYQKLKDIFIYKPKTL
jgi:hypothetical protein